LSIKPHRSVELLLLLVKSTLSAAWKQPTMSTHSAGKRSKKRTISEADEGGAPGPPIREDSSHRLFASHITLDCALRRGCVPCAYKIGCFDVALDKEFSRQVPNQRPEMCPRSSDLKGKQGTLGYTSGMRVLTIGDGDFSFSLAIARISTGKGLVATSYESRETLREVYPGIQETLSELESLGAKIHFNVDATNIQATVASATTVKFDRIVWNFPCGAVSKGRDGQNEEMELNKSLVRRFVDNARHLLKRSGQIHINHKTKVRKDILSSTGFYRVRTHILMSYATAPV
jgi:hypothetical protein